MQPHYSQSSRDNATPSSGTSPPLLFTEMQMNCGVFCNLAKSFNGKLSNSNFSKKKNDRDGGLDSRYFKIA